MAYITTRLFNYVPKNALLLAGDEYLRPLARLGDWTRIRLGILVAIDTPPGYTGNIYDGTFLFGLCSGRANTASGFACDNAIGVSLAGQAGASTIRNWAYNANSGNPYYNLSATSAYFYRRYANPYPYTGTISSINQVYVNSTVISTATYTIPVAGMGIRKRRLPFVLDISRNPTSGVYTFQLYFPVTTSVSTEDFRPDQLLDAVDQPGTPNVGGLAWTASGAQTLSLSELTGPLDTFSVYWGRQTFPLELYAACASLLQDAGLPQAAYPSHVSGWDYFAGVSEGTVTSILNTGDSWPGAYVINGTSGTYAQTGLAGTSSAVDEPFAQYVAGTVTSQGGTLSAGTLWMAPWLIAGTYGNPLPAQVTQLYGTTAGFPDEAFDTYTPGTVTSTMSGGTGWSAPWTFGGTYGNTGTIPMASVSTLVNKYGTTFGPDDAFDQYSTGSRSVMAAGTGWAAPSFIQYFAGTTYPNAAMAFDIAGTSCGFPWDSFEGTAAGTYSVISTGTGWSTYGTIYSY